MTKALHSITAITLIVVGCIWYYIIGGWVGVGMVLFFCVGLGIAMAVDNGSEPAEKLFKGPKRP